MQNGPENPPGHFFNSTFNFQLSLRPFLTACEEALTPREPGRAGELQNERRNLGARWFDSDKALIRTNVGVVEKGPAHGFRGPYWLRTGKSESVEESRRGCIKSGNRAFEDLQVECSRHRRQGDSLETRYRETSPARRSHTRGARARHRSGCAGARSVRRPRMLPSTPPWRQTKSIPLVPCPRSRSKGYRCDPSPRRGRTIPATLAGFETGGATVPREWKGKAAQPANVFKSDSSTGRRNERRPLLWIYIAINLTSPSNGYPAVFQDSM